MTELSNDPWATPLDTDLQLNPAPLITTLSSVIQAMEQHTEKTSPFILKPVVTLSSYR